MQVKLLFAVSLLLLSLPATAQEFDGEPLAELDDMNKALNRVMVGPLVRVFAEEDLTGFFTVMLAASGDSVFSGSTEEFGFTEEQQTRFRELMRAVNPEISDVSGDIIDQIREKLVENRDYNLTEDEDALVISYLSGRLTALNGIAMEVFTDEQIQKMDGMMLAMTGGLESPFFNDRHMEAIGMTDRQKEQFKKINEEMQPMRDKLIAGVSAEVEKMFNFQEYSFQRFTAVITQLREYQKALKQRRMEVLTDAQIAKAKKLATAPKFMSVFNLLPQWTPGPDAWRPGMPLPVEVKEQRRGNFPRPRSD